MCIHFFQYNIFVSDNHDENDSDDSDEGPPFKSSPSSSKKIP